MESYYNLKSYQQHLHTHWRLQLKFYPSANLGNNLIHRLLHTNGLFQFYYHDTDDSANNSPLTALNAPKSAAGNAKWTYMVYLDADNNLESYILEDIDETLDKFKSNIKSWDNKGSKSTESFSHC